MSLKKIIRKNIEDSAVTEPKIANEAVTVDKISDDFVTGLTELSEQAASNDTLLIYDTSAGLLKKVSKSNITDLDTPTVSSISPTSVSSTTGTTSFTITGTGFTAGSNARLIGSNGRVRNFDSVTRNSTTQITAVFDNTLLSASENPYSIQVINGIGINDLLANQVDFNQVPTFVTASGSLGSQTTNTAGSFSVNATDPDSAGNVTFELQSGSLPPGYSITNTAADGGTAIISGTDTTTSTTTTFNFVLRAVDAASNTSTRSFSITSSIPVSESFTSSGTFSVPSYVTSLDVLVVGGGGSGASGSGGSGGGGAGGLIFMPNYPVTPGGTVTVTVGCGGAGTSSGCNGRCGQDSAFGSPGDPGLGQGGVLTAKGGGRGDGGGGGTPGGSGGGGVGYYPGAYCNNPGGSATQPTQPGNSGAYGFGNAGGTGGANCGPGQIAGGGGGGGAGAVGPGGVPNNSNTQGGSGGTGKAYTIADGTTPVYYSGGGGGSGGARIACAPGPLSGVGQGGGTAGNATGASQNASANRGGGSGAGERCSGSGNGGKGIVIVRY